MDKVDLTQILKKLNDWKKSSPTAVYNLLDQIGTQNFGQNRIVHQKFLLAVQKLAQLQEIPPNSIYKSYDYEKMINKAKSILKILRQPLQMEVEKEKPEPMKKHNLFAGYQQQYTGYVDRIQNLNLISNLILHIFKNWDQTNKEQLISIDKIKAVTIGLEKEIYLRNFYKDSRKMTYEMDIKTLLQFMKRDKTGDVLIRVFNKSLSYEQAAQLKSEDWIDEKTKLNQQAAQKEELEINQIGFYKEISKREMDGVEGKQCRGCHQKKVYLVDEKQTRCADEPTTKFFECFNCGDKFRV
ncbi:unnamed protein product (macronuclear) [Paramecium tetraurelia]|uniref:TFIIS central domain-containing protein n=1 Tax=Paramecium tetraurelia TaxID=5888 RepID=A0DZ62_PARTE|nr:uncharacterized protein GSPATT00003298001 [Paramecium tetraurelia]CAK88329.1 unnamed protein product [Paramecium tetraurelia]|eukprot:XP_001455726.1 hypothetical protein (macronuclear) [Paramecium tetraurelia strain d4-2]